MIANHYDAQVLLPSISPAEVRTTSSTTVTMRHLVNEGVLSTNKEATVSSPDAKKRIVTSVAKPAPNFDFCRPSTAVPHV
jgi:hypothetical protein